MQTHANIEAAVLAFTAAWLPLSRTVTVARNIKHLVHLFGDAGAVVTHPSASRRWYVHNLTSPLVAAGSKIPPASSMSLPQDPFTPVAQSQSAERQCPSNQQSAGG